MIVRRNIRRELRRDQFVDSTLMRHLAVAGCGYAEIEQQRRQVPSG